jgi:hypothetical protein
MNVQPEYNRSTFDNERKRFNDLNELILAKKKLIITTNG